MDNLRQRVLLLGGRRKELEDQREAIIKYLLELRITSSSKLVDREGFPRTDIDIEDVIDKRKNLAILSTDIKIINAEIDKLIAGELPECDPPQLGREPPECDPPQLVRTTRVNSKNEDAYLEETPFAIVEGVVENSPAAKAGLKDGDYIMRFSHYSSEDAPRLAVLGAFVNSQKGIPLSLLIRRNKAHYWLRITPMEFHKSGVLGFTMKSLPKAR